MSASKSLRLVTGEAAAIVPFDAMAAETLAARELRAAARDFAARNGKNPYSDFLLKYGFRPDRTHAATLGRLINKRVRAADGTLQPQLTSRQRAVAKATKARKTAESSRISQIAKLICAVRDLSEISMIPEDLVSHFSPQFDVPVIRENLNLAVEYLNRLSEEWFRHEEGATDGAS
jgi:hypothetical protein